MKRFYWISAALFVFFVGLSIQAATVCIKTAGTPTPTPTPGPPGTTITLGGTVYTINPHPRIHESPSRVSALRSRSVAGKTLWNALVTNNNTTQAGCTAAAFDIVHMYSWAVGYLSDPTKSVWRDCAVAHFNKISALSGSYNVADYISFDFEVYAEVYDILYQDLNSTQRLAFINWMFSTGLPQAYTHAYNHHTNPDYTSNLEITKWAGEYEFALSCVGEDSRCDSLVTYNYNWYRSNPLAAGSLKSVVDQYFVGCHNYSGSHYGRVRSTPLLIDGLDSETTALGINSWPSWADDCPQYFVQSTIPEFVGGTCTFTNPPCQSYFDAQFYPGAQTWDQGRNLRAMLVPLERDHSSVDHQRAQDWLKTTHTPVDSPFSAVGRINSSASFGGKEYLPEWHLRYDQDAPTQSYTSYPTAYFATGLGQVFSRDAWGSGDKFWMEADASSFVGDHQTTGCGSFKLFKNGEFGVVENDTKYSAGNSDQTGLASYARNIMVMGNGQVTYSSSSYLTGGFGVYGQASTCILGAHSQSSTYAYWQSNLDGAYRSDVYPMDFVRRNFFHLKPYGGSTKNFVVLLDMVDPTNSITITDQFYVPKTSPTISDPDVSFTLTNTKTMIRRIYPASGATIAGVAVSDLSADAGCVQCGSGMSKVQIATSAASTARVIGVVMSMQGTSGSMPSTAAISGASGNLVGVVINDSPAGRAVFSSKNTATVSGNFAIDLTGTTATNNLQVIISGLPASQQYTTSGLTTFTPSFTAVGSDGTLQADNQGVLTFVMTIAE